MKKSLFLCLIAGIPLFLPGNENSDSFQSAPLVENTASAQTAVQLPDYGMYTLSCVTGGKFMEVTGNLLYNEKFNDQRKIGQNAASITTGETDGWQQWYVIYKLTVGDVRYYHIRNVFSGKVLEVPKGTTVVGTQLQQASESSTVADKQLWRLERIDTCCTRIINKSNGLAITNADASTHNGKAIVQEIAGTGDKQKWVFTPQTADTYRDDQIVRFFNRNQKSQGAVAFDEGTSIPLTWGANKGKVLWVTQDAWDGSSLQANGKFDCNHFFSYGNSILIQPSATNWDNTATPSMTINNSAQGRPKQICNIQPNNTFAWPGPGVEIDNLVYLQCSEGRGLDPTNQSLYILTQSTGNQWSVIRTTPAGMSGQAAINYANGMVKATDGYIYSFGSHYTGFGYSSNLYVARFPLSNPQSWTFWNGTTWDSKPVTGTTSRITDGLGSSYVAYLNGKYILVTMDQGFNCDSSRAIYIATANSPTGPFTARKKVYSIKEYLYGKYARYYTPAIHPQAVNGRNELLVTYCLNYSACGVKECLNGFLDPYFYRVKGIRIPYSKIGL
ncbi:RICIN domain-containing protein [Spirosoma sp. BT702]|uniref:RICIN domain-containing protein n=1 Tax=Spirosoma profusum TaxID=2771354 RepID=A0A927APC9_9BACT|nr:RICIN domain-containing protein [Spirosoma profusum]MBD2704024.1 RICIN domain-containing protein [Spirosoma profusum]